ncbi:MAG: DUF1800 domain-containing protein [Acidimicrobiales bacterium]
MTVDTSTAIAWITRRAGFGLAPGELGAAVIGGIDGYIDRLVDPDAHGVPAAPEAWESQLPAADDRDARNRRARRERAVTAWLERMVVTPRPLHDWLTWFWHGHFATGLDKVRLPRLMIDQIGMLTRLAFGPFPELVRAITVDPAMLIYLDGRASVKGRPNENYGRELLELFTVGIDNFAESDVRAAAVALTGWRLDDAFRARFAARRHDPSPQTLLGRPGVSDVDGVVAAITEDPRCAEFIAGKLARAILGPEVPPERQSRLAATFRHTGLDVRALVRAILWTAVHDPASRSPIVVAPVPWLVAAQRATGARIEAAVALSGLRQAGQVPLQPPNVGGWPTGPAWLGAGPVVARINLAGAVARATPPESPAFSAADRRDVDALALALGRPEGFGPATRRALADADGGPVATLTVALASPDLAVI